MTENEFDMINPRIAELVGGEVTPVTGSLDEDLLARFGDALRAPATAAELAGMDAARKSFLAHAGRRESQRGVRTAGVVGVGMCAILLAGGVAAAATGSLPASLQRLAHTALGAPAAAGDHPAALGESNRPVGPDATSDASTRWPDPGRTSASVRSASASDLPTPSAGSVGNSAWGLCHAWSSVGKPVNPDSAIVRGLRPLAGGAGIDVFCTRLLSAAPTAPAGYGHSHASQPGLHVGASPAHSPSQGYGPVR